MSAAAAGLRLTGLALCLLGVTAVAIGVGAVPLGIRELLAALWGEGSPSTVAIVQHLRLPRALQAALVGAALATSGATFQALLRNPLADPYVLGTASGAALGAAIAIALPVRLLVVGLGLVHVLAFAGALLAVWLVYRLSRAAVLGSLTGLLLTGYAVGSLLAAGLSLTMYLAGANLRQIFFYLLGSFATASWERLAVAAPLILAGSALILARARSLNGLLLGEETAGHLGLDVARERAVLLALASLVTAAAVAVSGLIGFVGLVVPHVVRLLVGPNARLVIPLAAISGGAFLGSADLLARLPGEVPVGIVTALVGAPFFLYLLRRVRSGYEL